MAAAATSSTIRCGNLTSAVQTTASNASTISFAWLEVEDAEGANRSLRVVQICPWNSHWTAAQFFLISQTFRSRILTLKFSNKRKQKLCHLFVYLYFLYIFYLFIFIVIFLFVLSLCCYFILFLLFPLFLSFRIFVRTRENSRTELGYDSCPLFVSSSWSRNKDRVMPEFRPRDFTWPRIEDFN